MADSPLLPGERSWVDGSGKRMPAEFYRFFRDWVRYQRTQGADEARISALEAAVAELQQGGATSADIDGFLSVQVFGSLSEGQIALQLVGDSENPGASTVYGTDALGNKGFYPVPTPPPARVNRITTTGAFRVTTDSALRITAQ